MIKLYGTFNGPITWQPDSPGSCPQSHSLVCGLHSLSSYIRVPIIEEGWICEDKLCYDCSTCHEPSEPTYPLPLVPRELPLSYLLQASWGVPRLVPQNQGQRQTPVLPMRRKQSSEAKVRQILNIQELNIDIYVEMSKMENDFWSCITN